MSFIRNHSLPWSLQRLAAEHFSILATIAMVVTVAASVAHADGPAPAIPHDRRGYVRSASPSDDYLGPEDFCRRMSGELTHPDVDSPVAVCRRAPAIQSGLCVPSMHEDTDLRVWAVRLDAALLRCKSEATIHLHVLDASEGNGAAMSICQAVGSMNAQLSEINAQLPASAGDRARWSHLFESVRIVLEGASALNGPLERAVARGALSALDFQVDAAREVVTSLLEYWQSQLSERPELVVRRVGSCHSELFELPFICSTGARTDTQRQALMYDLLAEPSGQACIPGDHTFVVDYANPPDNTTNYPDARDVNTRWLIINHAPPEASVTVLSAGDRRASALALAALAFRAAGAEVTSHESEAQTGAPRSAVSRARIRVVRIDHGPIDDVSIVMAEPGRTRSHLYHSMPRSDLAFGASLSLDWILQDGHNGPYGRVTSTADGVGWQPQGIGDPRAGDGGMQVVPAATAHLFVGARVGDYLLALETPLVSTTGGPFRGLGLRMGRRFRSISPVSYLSVSGGFRVDRRENVAMATSTDHLPDQRGLAGYVTLGLAFDLREGLRSIAPD